MKVQTRITAGRIPVRALIKGGRLGYKVGRRAWSAYKAWKNRKRR